VNTLTISPLRQDQIDASYPLMLSALPDLSLDRWRSYAAEVAGLNGRGVMIASALNGTLRGAFTFEIRGANGRDRELSVDAIVIPPLGRGLVARALGEALMELATERGCTAVTVHLPADAEWKIDYFTRLGCEVSLRPPRRTLEPLES
jgi:hypothetical protein